MNSPSLIITLDGPSGSGKSTASVKLARHFKIPCLDTGAMYRTVGLKALQNKIDLDAEEEIAKIAQSLDFKFRFEGEKPVIEVREAGKNFELLGKEIRTMEVSMAASRIAKLKKVREILVQKQREIGSKEGAVVEGRDAGTVIFPYAKIKFFVTASIEERAKRRYQELQEKLGTVPQTLEQVQEEMRIRDKQDSERAVSPLKPAPDSLLVDTSGMTLAEVIQTLIGKVESLLKP